MPLWCAQSQSGMARLVKLIEIEPIKIQKNEVREEIGFCQIHPS